MSRPTPQVFMDLGNLIVKEYYPNQKYKNNKGLEATRDAALVYTDMGSPELNEEQAKHAILIHAYSNKARAALKIGAQHIDAPDGRDVPVRRLPNVLEAYMHIDDRPTIPDKNDKTKQVENPYYLAKTVQYRLTGQVRGNPIDNTFVTLKDNFKIRSGVSQKTGKPYNVVQPASYIKGALIFPACASKDPKMENGRPYDTTTPKGERFQGRILDMKVGDFKFRLFVPQERLNDKKYQQIFDFIDNAENKAPMVVNLAAPLNFSYRAPLDENGNPREGATKRVLESRLGLPTSLDIVQIPTNDQKAEASDDMGQSEIPPQAQEEMDDYGSEMNQTF